MLSFVDCSKDCSKKKNAGIAVMPIKQYCEGNPNQTPFVRMMAEREIPVKLLPQSLLEEIKAGYCRDDLTRGCESFPSWNFLCLHLTSDRGKYHFSKKRSNIMTFLHEFYKLNFRYSRNAFAKIFQDNEKNENCDNMYCFAIAYFDPNAAKIEDKMVVVCSSLWHIAKSDDPEQSVVFLSYLYTKTDKPPNTLIHDDQHCFKNEVNPLRRRGCASLLMCFCGDFWSSFGNVSHAYALAGVDEHQHRLFFRHGFKHFATCSFALDVHENSLFKLQMKEYDGNKEDYNPMCFDFSESKSMSMCFQDFQETYYDQGKKDEFHELADANRQFDVTINELDMSSSFSLSLTNAEEHALPTERNTDETGGAQENIEESRDGVTLLSLSNRPVAAVSEIVHNATVSVAAVETSTATSNADDGNRIDAPVDDVDELAEGEGEEEIKRKFERPPWKLILDVAECSFDIDSISLHHKSMCVILETLQDGCSVEMETQFSYYKQAQGSRFGLKFSRGQGIAAGNASHDHVKLSGMPNVTMFSVLIGSTPFYMNLFWINPPFIKRNSDKGYSFSQLQMSVIVLTMRMAKDVLTNQTLSETGWDNQLSDQEKQELQKIENFGVAGKDTEAPRGTLSKSVAIALFRMFDKCLLFFLISSWMMKKSHCHLFLLVMQTL